MERIGSIWTMIVRYLLLVMFGGVIVWACNSAGISVYNDRHLRADGREIARHFQPDHAAADADERFRTEGSCTK